MSDRNGKIATFKGWEYLTKNELHMYISKRHVFVEGRKLAVCGVKPSLRGAHANEGDEPCERCLDWACRHGFAYGSNSFVVEND